MKLKLLYAIPLVGSIEWVKANGSFNKYSEEFKYLNKSFEINLISKDSKKYDIEDIKVHEGLYNFPLSIRNILFLFFPLLKPKLFKQSDVYYADHVSGAFPLVLAKYLFGKKVIVRFDWDWSFVVKKEYNFLTYFFVRLLENISIKNSDLVITTTPYLKKVILNRYNFKKRIAVIPNWVDSTVFKPSKVKKNNHSIISNGRLVESKDFLLLLKSVKNLGNGYSLTIIGSGPCKSELVKYAIDNKVKFRILGKVTNSKIPELLNSSQFFVSTSKYEGQSRAILEAMSCGIPTIATNVIGNRDTIINNENGILTNRNSEEINRTILELYKNAKLRNKISRHARSYILKNCDLKIVMNKTQKEINLLSKNV